MFRKHGGWKFNQHIRIIQRLVPRRQHFSHYPIHASRSIFPPPALPSQDVLGHLPATASFSGPCSVLIVHWPGFTITVRLSWSVVPVSFTLSFVLLHLGGGIYGLHTYTFLISFSIVAWSIIQHVLKTYGSTWDHKEQLTVNFPFLCPWGDWCRILLPSDYSFSMPWGWLWINGEDLVFGLEISVASETARDILGRPLPTVLRSSFLLHTIVLFLSVWSHTASISPLLTGMETEVTVHQAAWELQR